MQCKLQPFLNATAPYVSTDTLELEPKKASSKIVACLLSVIVLHYIDSLFLRLIPYQLTNCHGFRWATKTDTAIYLWRDLGHSARNGVSRGSGRYDDSRPDGVSGQLSSRLRLYRRRHPTDSDHSVVCLERDNAAGDDRVQGSPEPRSPAGRKHRPRIHSVWSPQKMWKSSR